MVTKEELEAYIEIVDRELKNIFKEKNKYNEKIYRSMEYSIFTGGKRLRPIMMIKTFEMFDKDLKKILPFAIAIEMIHTYSLIHDDLPSMDNDDIRRGKPTNHKVYGEAMAILSGDGLLNLSMETMVKFILTHSSPQDYKRYLKAMDIIYDSSGCKGMIGGQVLDIFGTKKNMEQEMLMYMYSTKTAALFKASIVVGALIGGASEEEIEHLDKFGLYLGLAYQIKDDILDIEKDENIDKLTYLSFNDLEESNKTVESLSEQAISQLNMLKDKDTFFLEDITRYLINRDI